MASVKNFEDLQAWQKARALTGFVYELTRMENFSRDWALCNQVRDASGSVMHNIAEGYEAGYDPEFARFLKMARRSAAEVQSELYLALDASYISNEELKKGYDLAVETKKLLNGLLKYLRTTNKKTGE